MTVPPVDHLQLPCDDGAMVHNFQELPQSILLTDTILPVAQRLYGDQFAIGQDCAIYYRQTDPPLDGAKAPDWFLVPNVPPLLDGQPRRSYVMWREMVAPLVLLEYVSGDGSEERDTTPETGKFWVYEHAIRPAYYGIFEGLANRIEMHRYVEDRFVRMEANQHGRYPIAQLGLELGIWQGAFMGGNLAWMRWWDADGNLLLTGHERAEQLAERLRQLGVDPDSV
jgi:Uma2 family endonuclease